MSMDEQLARKLNAALAPEALEIINESHHHAGHASSPGTGESHYRVVVRSAKFNGLSRLARHRLVNAAVAEELKSSVHALAITALAIGE